MLVCIVLHICCDITTRVIRINIKFQINGNYIVNQHRDREQVINIDSIG